MEVRTALREPTTHDDDSNMLAPMWRLACNATTVQDDRCDDVTRPPSGNTARNDEAHSPKQDKDGRHDNDQSHVSANEQPARTDNGNGEDDDTTSAVFHFEEKCDGFPPLYLPQPQRRTASVNAGDYRLYVGGQAINGAFASSCINTNKYRIIHAFVIAGSSISIRDCTRSCWRQAESAKLWLQAGSWMWSTS